jgi:hypothetical protein
MLACEKTSLGSAPRPLTVGRVGLQSGHVLRLILSINKIGWLPAPTTLAAFTRHPQDAA